MIMKTRHPSLSLIFFSFLLGSSPSFAIDFIFNSTSLSLYGNATIQFKSNILTLTNPYPHQIGRALYPHKIPNKSNSSILPFTTSFIFAMAPGSNLFSGHGFVFLFTPVTGIQNTSSAQHLGLFSRAVDGDPNNHVFGVEFDVIRDEEFRDFNDNHVGIDMNSVTSIISYTPGYYPDDGRDFTALKLNDGRNYQVWIKYSGFTIDVTMAPAGEKPGGCFICGALVNLSTVFEDEIQCIMECTQGLPSFVPTGEPINRSTGFIVGLSLGVFFVVVTCGVVGFIWVKSKMGLANKKAEMEEEDLDQLSGMPTRFSYKELKIATENFSKKLGEGGFGSVFEGSLKDGSKIAVKCLEGQPRFNQLAAFIM
ncbi:hypothetical protein R6Q57_021839 [Mikania cordata]